MVVLKTQTLYVKEIYEKPKHAWFRRLRIGDQIYIRHKIGDEHYVVDNTITGGQRSFSEKQLYECLNCFRFGVCE